MLNELARSVVREHYPRGRDLLDLSTALVVGFVIAVTIGGSLAMVASMTIKDVLTPALLAITGKPDVLAIRFTVNGCTFLIGELINSVILLLITTASVFLVLFLPVKRLLARVRGFETRLAATTKECPECRSIIHLEARRCAFCTSPVTRLEPTG